MSYFASNLKYLRRTKGLTQDMLAQKVNINRAQVGSYEESRAEPKFEVLRRIAYYFKVSIHDLVDTDMEKQSTIKPGKKGSMASLDLEGKGLRVLPIVVDRQNKEQITIVPVKAAAGYMQGYADAEYIEQLPTFNLPFDKFRLDRTYRAFQITGDSMLPVQPGSYVIGEYITNWNDLRDGKACVVVTNEGIVFKRVYNYLKDRGTLLLKSDNIEYAPYEVQASDVVEIWLADGFISFEMPAPDDVSMHSMGMMMVQMQKEIDALKKQNVS
jgi:transcriptional regulator with XRE-family HTH domain